MKWHFVDVLRLVAPRVTLLVLGALIGGLADAGLLDGQVADALQSTLSGW